MPNMIKSDEKSTTSSFARKTRHATIKRKVPKNRCNTKWWNSSKGHNRSLNNIIVATIASPANISRITIIHVFRILLLFWTIDLLSRILHNQCILTNNKAPFYNDLRKLIVDHLRERRSPKGCENKIAKSAVPVKSFAKEKPKSLSRAKMSPPTPAWHWRVGFSPILRWGQ